MSTCLVTRLKATVQDSSIPKIGAFLAGVKVDGNLKIAPNGTFRPVSGGELLITILDEGVTFASASGGAVKVDSKNGIFYDNYLNELTFSGVSANTTVNVRVTSSYDLGYIGINVSSLGVASIEYATGLTGIRFSSSVASGDLSKLRNLTNVATLVMGFNNDIVGDISILGKLTALTTINLASVRGNFTGNWKDFVAAQKENGRTTCDSLEVAQIYYCQIGFGKYGNSRLGTDDGNPGILKWSGDKISLQKDAASIVYTIGYTAEEAASAFPGYTYYLAD